MKTTESAIPFAKAVARSFFELTGQSLTSRKSQWPAGQFDLIKFIKDCHRNNLKPQYVAEVLDTIL